MTPEVDFRVEGNSVDPPSLQQAAAIPPDPAGLSLDIKPPSSLPEQAGPAGTFVFESSTTSSRARLESFSSTDKRARTSTFMLNREAQTSSMSASAGVAAGVVSSLNESNSATASSTLAYFGENHLQAPSDESYACVVKDRVIEKSNKTSFDFKTVKKEIADVEVNGRAVPKFKPASESNSADQGQGVRNPEQPQEEPLATEHDHAKERQETKQQFNFETTELACRLKPQLTSTFLSQELESTPEVKIDVDQIMRKYGIETRKYKPPAIMSKYAGGDSFGKTPSSSALHTSYNSFSSSRSFSMVQTGNRYSAGKPAPSHPLGQTFRNMDVSQNNEALEKLLNPAVETESKEQTAVKKNIVPEQPVMSHLPTQTPVSYLGKDFASRGNEACMPVAQSVPLRAASSTNVDPIKTNDVSKNNDAELEQEEKVPPATTEVSAAHGSSVDIAVTDASDRLPGYAKVSALSPAGSYSVLRGTTTMTGYQSSYAGMRLGSGMRASGYSMPSQPSNMDMMPFEGAYLRNHLSSSKYSSTTGLGASPADMTPSGASSAGGSKDSLSPYGTNFSLVSSLGSPTDALGYSLQQERQRLRSIDNLITSGPTRPYMSIHHGASSSSSTGSPLAVSRNTSVGSWAAGGGTPGAASYDDPNDMAIIRRAGSNVDTGQFNNNRARHSSMYNPELVEKIISQRAAWAGKDPPGRGDHQAAGRGRQQQQQQRRYPQQKQRQEEKKGVKAATARGPPRCAGAKPAQQSRVASSQKVSATCKNRSAASKPGKNGAGAVLSAKSKNCRGVSGCDCQVNNSLNNITNGFDFARELNRMWAASVLGENYLRDCVDSSNKAGLARNGGANRDKGYVGSIKAGGIKTTVAVSSPTTSSNNSTANRKPPRGPKYQPYRAQARRYVESERQQEPEDVGQAVGENPSRSPGSATSVTSASRASLSQHSCRELEQACGGQPLSSCVARCGSWHDVTHRNLVAATALASGLIQRRQQQQHPQAGAGIPGARARQQDAKRRGASSKSEWAGPHTPRRAGGAGRSSVPGVVRPVSRTAGSPAGPSRVVKAAAARPRTARGW